MTLAKPSDFKWAADAPRQKYLLTISKQYNQPVDMLVRGRGVRVVDADVSIVQAEELAGSL